MRRMITALAATAIIIVLAAPRLSAEQACIKYHECINVDAFKCDRITRSSFIHRVCYLEPKRYMVIWFKRRNGGISEPYHYCNIGSDTMKEFFGAPSMGRYFNQNITGTKKRRGPFDCRDHEPPKL